MHYYKRNIGDYHRKAGRLNILQHGTYTLLIDACYDREKFPTIDEAIDWVWAATDDEIAAVKFVLKKFFIENNGVYEQKRIREEIDNYKKNSETNKRIAQEREAKRKGNSTNRVQAVDEAPPNQEPLTINEEPLTNIKDVFVFWKETFKKRKNTELSPKRKKAISGRLKKYPIEEIKQAIVNCSRNEWNIKNGFTDIELICRNSENLERYRDLIPMKAKPESKHGAIPKDDNQLMNYASKIGFRAAKPGETFWDYRAQIQSYIEIGR